MMHQHVLYPWLALLRMPKIGVRQFHKIWELFPDLTEFFTTSPTWRQQQGYPAQLVIDETGVTQDLSWLNQAGNRHILTLADSHYPFLLRQMSAPPPLLYVEGNVSALTDRQLAIVGSRHATPSGLEIAENFAKTLTEAGLTITSGLAAGIDAAAHQGTLRGKGKTVAIMATGLDRIYPKRHRKLAEAIVAGHGALVSEFPLGTPPLAQHFPRRNRIISGLSWGVLVVEASLRSGALITAQFANEQGREVFAIPGSIYNPLARGCHALIKQGAKLVENCEEILEECLGLTASPSPSPPSTPITGHLAKNLQELLKYVDFEPVLMDQLMVRSQWKMSDLAMALTTLELEGYIIKTATGYARAKL